MTTDCLGQPINPGDYVVYCYVNNYAPTNRIGRVTSIVQPKTEYRQPSVIIHCVALPTYKNPEVKLVRSSVSDSDRLVVIPEHLVPTDKKAFLADLKIKA